MRIYEIFTSIDGEVNSFYQGRITTFIRFSGCNLSCQYCDTKYAQDPASGEEMSVAEVVNEVKKLGCKKVTITGGEPLYQSQEFFELTRSLWHKGHEISVETNGSFYPAGYGVGSWVMDFKLPSSGCFDKMDHNNFKDLNKADWVKFVISDRNDYDTAIREMNYLRSIGCNAMFAFSPCFGVGPQKMLVDWLIEDKEFDVVINLQLHKLMGVKLYNIQ